jgi:tetratricopeptide (TPR) repeat protein
MARNRCRKLARQAGRGWIVCWACVVVLAFTSAVWVRPTHAQTVRHHKVAVEDPSLPQDLMQAEALIDKKDFAAAEPALQKVTERDPANYRAWFDLGFVYNAQGRPEDSIAAYRKSVAAKPDVFESNLNLGLMLARANQPDAAQFLRAATKLKPSDHMQEGQARAWLSLGHVLEATDRQGALEAYAEAARLQPKDPEPLLSAGAILEKDNRFAEAEQQYKQVLSLEPNQPDALIGIANIYMRGRRLLEAADTLRKLVAVHPEYAAAHIQLARVLAADGKNDEAIAEFQAGLKIDPGDEVAQRELASTYAVAGRFHEAQSLYQSLLATRPRDAMLHHGLGQAYLRQRKFPEAQQEFLTAIDLKPDLGAAYGDLAAAANENKSYALVIRALEARAKLLPEVPGTLFLRATAYDHLRAYKEAAANYHLFLEASNGQFPEQEWQARHRLIAIEPKK